MKNVLLLLLLWTLSACYTEAKQSNNAKPIHTQNSHTNPHTTMNQSTEQPIDSCVLAGGCFWCLDAVYRQMQGIINVESGYSNGQIKNPTYREVCSGRTGHAEVAKIYFNPTLTSYQQILEVFWRIHNPTTLSRQKKHRGGTPITRAHRQSQQTSRRRKRTLGRRWQSGHRNFTSQQLLARRRLPPRLLRQQPRKPILRLRGE